MSDYSKCRKRQKTQLKDKLMSADERSNFMLYYKAKRLLN